MRRLSWALLFLLMLGGARVSHAAPSEVQFVVDASSTPWVTDGIADITVGSLTVGNTVCVGGGVESSRTFTATDNGGTPNTYTIPTNGSIGDGNSSVFMACAKVTNAATVISVTASSATAAVGKIFAIEFSSTGPSAPTVATNLSDVTGTAHTIPTLTITGSNPVLVGFGFATGTETWTIDGNYTSKHNANNLVVGYQAVTGNDDMANTTATNAVTKSVLVEIVNAAGGVTPRGMLLGVFP